MRGPFPFPNGDSESHAWEGEIIYRWANPAFMSSSALLSHGGPSTLRYMRFRGVDFNVAHFASASAVDDTTTLSSAFARQTSIVISRGRRQSTQVQPGRHWSYLFERQPRQCCCRRRRRCVLLFWPANKILKETRVYVRIS